MPSFLYNPILLPQAFVVAQMVKNLPAMQESGRYPEEENVYPLQYFCLENSMDRGAWQATVHRVEKSWTRLKQLSMQITESGYHTPETNTALSIKYKVKLKKNRILL